MSSVGSKRTIWTITTLILSLAFSEAILRTLVTGNGKVVQWQMHPEDGRCVAPEAGTASDYTGTTIRTDSVRHGINKQGYRNSGILADGKGHDVSRIAFLGNAFVFGQGVGDDSTIPAYLTAILNPDGDRSIEVMNLGVPGYNIQESVDQYEKFARQWHPKRVILFLSTNDSKAPLCDQTQNIATWWLYNHSTIFRVFYIAMTPLIDFVMPSSSDLPADAMVRTQLKRLAKITDEDGARLFVVLAGDPASPGNTIAGKTAAELDVLDIPWLDFAKWMDPAISDESIPLSPERKSFSAEGNKIAAKDIARWLIENDQVLKPPPAADSPDSLCGDLMQALFNRLEGFRTVATSVDDNGLHMIMERDAHPRHLLMAMAVFEDSLYTFQTLRGEGDQSLADSPIGTTLGSIFEAMGQSEAIMKSPELQVRTKPLAQTSFSILDKMYGDLFAPPEDKTGSGPTKAPLAAIMIILVLAIIGASLTAWLVAGQTGNMNRTKE